MRDGCRRQRWFGWNQLGDETRVAELKNGQVTEYFLKPEDFAIDSKSLIGLLWARESLTLIKDALVNVLPMLETVILLR